MYTYYANVYNQNMLCVCKHMVHQQPWMFLQAPGVVIIYPSEESVVALFRCVVHLDGGCLGCDPLKRTEIPSSYMKGVGELTLKVDGRVLVAFQSNFVGKNEQE